MPFFLCCRQLQDERLQCTQPGAAEESLPAGEAQHVRDFKMRLPLFISTTIPPPRSRPLLVVLTLFPNHILPARHSSCLQPVADPYTLSVFMYIVFFPPLFPVDRRSLMEQLRRLQALIMNTSNKPAQTGTCVLVCFRSRLPTNNQTTVQPLKINNHSTNAPSCRASQCLDVVGSLQGEAKGPNWASQTQAPAE